MRESLVMTVIGKDRTGLVESLAEIIEDHGGNWEESRMVRLSGEFAGLVHVHVPRDRSAELEAALSALEGLSVVVTRASEEPRPPAGSHVLELDAVGQDHPGIVRRISEAIAALGINIEELETAVTSAPMSGEQLFHAQARLRAPTEMRLEEIEQSLERLAADLMVDIHLEEPG